mgnify:CR=1 FL=1
MQRGIIKKIDYIKGFGFIVTEDDDEVYFNLHDVHPKFKGKTFKEGEKVGFDLKREIKGDRAVNLRPL